MHFIIGYNALICSITSSGLPVSIMQLLFLVKKVTKVFLYKKAYSMHLYQADPCEQTFQNSRMPWTKQARTTLSSETLHIILFKILGRIEKILDYHFFHFRTLPSFFQFHFNRILSPSSPHSKRFSLKAFKDFAFRTDCVIECFVF